MTARWRGEDGGREGRERREGSAMGDDWTRDMEALKYGKGGDGNRQTKACA